MRRGPLFHLSLMGYGAYSLFISGRTSGGGEEAAQAKVFGFVKDACLLSPFGDERKDK